MKSFKQHKDDNEAIKMNVQLFIRLLEFAREDAKDDKILHIVAENARELHKEGKGVLTMEDYDELIEDETKEKD